MSAAVSKLVLESPTMESSPLPEDEPIPEDEQEALAKLSVLSPPTSSGPVIAVDLDDVLCQTNEVICEWHNDVYGTKMNISSFYYYYYWKNPFWGTIKETVDKVNAFYATERIFQAEPVHGAREGVQSLRDLGYRLIIVTARSPDNHEQSWKWVNDHFPGLFDSIICTGQFKDAHKKIAEDRTHEVVTKLSKGDVCKNLGARILIDDSAENALQCASSNVPVLLFGNYEWNKRHSGPVDATDKMSFDIRLKDAGGHEFWKDESVDVPPGAPLWRVKDWAETVRWIMKAAKEGRL